MSIPVAMPGWQPNHTLLRRFHNISTQVRRFSCGTSVVGSHRMIYKQDGLRNQFWYPLEKPTSNPSLQMSSYTDCQYGILRTADGGINLAKYEALANMPENVPGIDMGETYERHELLEKVREQLVDLPPLIERSFQPVLSGDTSTVNGFGDGQCVRVMQWNILADALSSGKDNFVRCPLAALSWQTRRLRILEEILTVDPDILTLQEVDHYGFLKHTLSTCGYQGVFFPKPDSPTLYVKGNHGPDGCALFFKTDKLNVLEKQTIVLKALPSLKETNQVAIIYHFKSKPLGKEFCVGTTHLKAKKGWERLRHQQGAYLIKYIEDHFMSKPVILCGDFNAEHTELVYDVCTASSLGLLSTYKVASEDGEEPIYTSWKIRGSPDGHGEKESKRTIDYMWFTNSTLRLHKVLELPSPEKIGKDKLPGYHYPSDHLSLVADYSIL